MDVESVVLLKSVTYDGYELGPIDVYVCDKLPSNVDIVLGLDVISHHGLSIERDSKGVLKLTLGREKVSASNVLTSTPIINDSDFEAYFVNGRWEAR